jgi:hypothetical protein
MKPAEHGHTLCAVVRDRLPEPASLEQNQNSRAQAKILQSGFYFHPCDEELSQGAPERKKPPRGRAIGYSYSGFALAAGRRGP